MTEEEFQALQDEQFAKIAPKKTSKLTSAARGALSGLTSGFQPQLAGIGAAIIPGGQNYDEAVTEAQVRNDLALSENPASYMGGYTAGTVGSLVGPGLAAKGTGLAAKRLLPEAYEIAALKGSGLSKSQIGNNAILDSLPGMFGDFASAPMVVKSKEALESARDMMSKIYPSGKTAEVVKNVATSTPVTQTVARTAGMVSNTPSFDDINQYLSEQEKRRLAMNQPKTRAELENSDSAAPVLPGP